jgi:uridine kinase
VVREVLAALRGRPFILVDGPAGSGKTTLAASLQAPVVHLDDLYDGWTGLDAGVAQAQRLVDELASGRPSGYRRYDWHRGEYAEWVDVLPAKVLVVEGCGAGSIRADGLLVWVEADPDVRLRRGLTRDGEAMRDHLIAWREAEAAVFARDRTRARAELVVRT